MHAASPHCCSPGPCAIFMRSDAALPQMPAPCMENVPPPPAPHPSCSCWHARAAVILHSSSSSRKKGKTLNRGMLLMRTWAVSLIFDSTMEEISSGENSLVSCLYCTSIVGLSPGPGCVAWGRVVGVLNAGGIRSARERATVQGRVRGRARQCLYSLHLDQRLVTGGSLIDGGEGRGAAPSGGEDRGLTGCFGTVKLAAQVVELHHSCRFVEEVPTRLNCMAAATPICLLVAPCRSPAL